MRTYAAGDIYRLARDGRLYVKVRNEVGALLIRPVVLPAGSEVTVVARNASDDYDRRGERIIAPPVFRSADGREGYVDPSMRGWPADGLLELVERGAATRRAA